MVFGFVYVSFCHVNAVCLKVAHVFNTSFWDFEKCFWYVFPLRCSLLFFLVSS